MDEPGKDADQLYAIDLRSGAERRLTSGANGVLAIAWSPRGDRIAFTRRDNDPVRRGADAFRDAFEVSANAYLSTRIARPSHLWSVDMRAAEHRLTAGAWSVANGPITWSADGTQLLYVRASSAIYGLQDRARAMRLAIASGQSSPATPQRSLQEDAIFSADGKHLAYRYSRDGDPINESEAMADGRDVSRALDRQVETLAWMPRDELLLQVYDRARAPLYVQPLDGAARRLPLGQVVSASIESTGSVARDGTIAFIGAQPRHPQELFVLPPSAGAPEQLTHYNDETAALDLGRPERIVWHDGAFTEDGVLTYPPGFRAGKRYPLVIRIHGGPALSSTTAFEPFYQLAAARGYLVFAPNYRGSNDLGNTYQRAIFNDASIGPGKDIMAGIAAVERLGIVDSSRIGVSGWSYGGQLTSWMESRYHIWRAAVAGAAVNDLVVDYAIADDIDADALAFSGGSPYKGNALALWRKHSPITYFKDIRTPTLILGNVYDVRVPIVESYEMYRALSDNGVPVQFFAYPTAGHLPSGPVRLADAYTRWLQWFDRYFKSAAILCAIALPQSVPALRAAAAPASCTPSIFAPRGAWRASRLQNGPGLVLSGGGLAQMPEQVVLQWMRSRVSAPAHARAGNLIILKASGGRDYTDRFYTLSRYASVREVLIPPCASRAGVDGVASLVDRADAVLFSGGDQAHYAAWKGSALIAAIRRVYARGGIVGGGSAGLAIQGQVIFDSVAADRVLPSDQDVATPDAVKDPYESSISFTTGYFDWPPLRGAITDTHVARRDRFGRLAAFMARALHEHLVAGPQVFGVAVDEGAALLVDARGIATLVERARESNGYVPRGAYVVEGGRAARLGKHRSLRYTVVVTHLSRPGSRYDLIDKHGAGMAYRVTVDGSRKPFYSSDPYGVTPR